MFWSDSSDEGWGAHLADTGVSGLWSQTDRALSINLRELIAVRLGLRHFLPRLQGQVVAVFSDSSTTVAYLRKQGGTVSSLLNQETQTILRWTEEHQITLVPQFILGHHNVLANSLSRRVAEQASFAKRSSTRLVYRAIWYIFRRWCRDHGHSVSRPTLPSIDDFILLLHE